MTDLQREFLYKVRILSFRLFDLARMSNVNLRIKVNLSERKVKLFSSFDPLLEVARGVFIKSKIRCAVQAAKDSQEVQY